MKRIAWGNPEHMPMDEIKDEKDWLAQQCRTMRQQGLDGSWTYSLPRHKAYLARYQKLKDEIERRASST